MKKIILSSLFINIFLTSSFPIISNNEAKICSGVVGMVSGGVVSFLISKKMDALQKKLDSLEKLKKEFRDGSLDHHDKIILEYLEKNKSDFFEKYLSGEENVIRRFVLVYGSLVATAVVAYILSYYILNSWTFDQMRDQLDKDLSFFEENISNMDENESRIYGEKLAKRISDLDSWKANEDGLLDLLNVEKDRLNSVACRHGRSFRYYLKPKSASVVHHVLNAATVGFTESIIQSALNFLSS